LIFIKALLFSSLLLSIHTVFAQSTTEDSVFIFSYFKGNGEDGLHLAYSKDGYEWKTLNDDHSLLSPAVGNSQLMRDPCIIRGGDGRFHMVWTAGWNEHGIGYANTEDLIHWSEQMFIPVMAHEPTARNCWAPQIFYDDTQQLYMIYWATTIPGRYPETENAGDDAYNHRIYYVTTKAFQTYSPTRLLYEQGFNVIDATVIKKGGEFVMF
jgi:sucrose-6-phosphate hydrolase SacC (GH32 family)